MEKYRDIGKWTKEWALTQNDLLPHYYETIESTNTFAKTLPSSPKIQLVITELQTHGRGRGSNSWLSPDSGSSLLSSWIFDTDFTPQPILSPLVGLCVYESMIEMSGFNEADISLKAPNDIYIKNKKVGGILIELQSQGDQTRVVIGIGLNVFEGPNLDSSTHMAKHRTGDIDDYHWNGFLIELYKKLKESVELSIQKELTKEDCDTLLSALNKNPLLSEKYSQVLPDGSLKTSNHTIKWSSL
jgi:BirA family biotin operon repressor/biotin-[acetyl-CoA-carboxylase] ligase